ncbi:RNA 2',3'-cyclic phosphodiesterase [Kamptonema cortianum]|nr:RNA 2',3'-cyclic phosphodiesterase [Geitlerinema splendidum]MDK3156345.1 RNA 2',3'-cyclic phosphodiesterase [Kamptonema cortianum]
MDLQERIRCFLSIEVGQSAVQSIKVTQSALSDLSDVYTLTDPNSFHQTLYFLGQCSLDQIEEVKSRMSDFQFKAFTAELGQLVVLPQLEIPKVLSVAIDSRGRKLHALQQAVQDRIFSVAEFKESRPFLPHVTFARLRRDVPPTAKVVKRTVSALPPTKSESWKVDRVILYSSDLRASGPKYEELASWVLSGSEH